jgi:hypothetical protein
MLVNNQEEERMGKRSEPRRAHGFIADYDELAKDPECALGQIASLGRLLELAIIGQRETDGREGDSAILEHVAASIAWIAQLAWENAVKAEIVRRGTAPDVPSAEAIVRELTDQIEVLQKRIEDLESARPPLRIVAKSGEEGA